MSLPPSISVSAQVDSAAPPALPRSDPDARAFLTIGGLADDWLRVEQLLGRGTEGFLLRSASSLSPHLPGEASRFRWSPIDPEVMFVRNSGLSFSVNDGALWAGRGSNALVRAGVRLGWRRVRLNLAPEFLYSENLAYRLVDPQVYPAPPPDRSPYSSPWFVNVPSIDLPLRMGDQPIRRVDVGQSALVVEAGPVEVGAAVENEWWGPGVRNALILSNNAPGFPHLFLRTGAPIGTRVGTFEGRWLVGGLSESAFFDSDPANDVRSISLLGVTWRTPWEPDLTLGAARAVFAPADGWGDALGDFAQVFANVGAPNAYPYADQTTRAPGRDQLFALFARWVFPSAGFETYAEWARAEQPTSLRDLLVEPNHTQGYTVGLHWVGPPVVGGGRVRIEGEASYLEKSTTFRFRPQGTWYTSRAVLQGYSHEGQVLGAAIGPGSSSQYLGLGYLAASWQAGVFAERIRWQNDVHSERMDYIRRLQGRCEHDVSVRWGLRALVSRHFGTIGASYSTGRRLNPFFIRPAECFPADNDDVRVKTLTVTFAPVVLRH